MARRRRIGHDMTNRWLTAGASGAAAVGIGVLLTTQPATTVRPVELASFDSLLAPASPRFSDEPWWVSSTGNRAGNPEVGSVAAIPMVGPGGWLIGDGADAAADCLAAACKGGSGGLLFGNGGAGANGGKGGNG
ncbi:MAG: hypothetical protein WA965_27040, partial [Mycobacterium sp.]